MTSILLATGNRPKQERLRWLIEGTGLQGIAPQDLGLILDPPESGETHTEIAASKAVAWSRAYDGPVIASDGGAVVPALGGSWNSLFTKRAAGAEMDDLARADHLLALMRGRTGSDRDIGWSEAVAVARDGVLLAVSESTGEFGRLVESYDPAKIGNGFWFPALVWVERFEKVVADLTPEERSHVEGRWSMLRSEMQPFLSGLAESEHALGQADTRTAWTLVDGH
jgi:XTP/dITP diphosphohydrolase